VNPYTIRGGDGLIWLEVTKLSPHRSRLRSKVAPELDRSDRKFFAFDTTKRNLTFASISLGRTKADRLPAPLTSWQNAPHETLNEHGAQLSDSGTSGLWRHW